MRDDGSKQSIVLTLSGGGLRAAAFHLGVLARLAADNALERVRILSTVSGGSICAAVVFGRKPAWPTSDEFLSTRFIAIRSLITSTDLLSLRSVGWRGLLRHGTNLALHRAKVLVHHLQYRWKIDSGLEELPVRPKWFINATNIETGKNWRFSRDEMGDWVHGRHYLPRYLIAEAVAASAAVPYVIGALRLTLPKYNWFRTSPSTRQRLTAIDIKERRVRLWDGGVYENLGLEAVYKPGKQAPDDQMLLVSDASGELGPPAGNPLLTIAQGHLAAPRLFDIAADQNRSLRSRMLVRDIENGNVRGALMRMGNSTRYIHTQASQLKPTEYYANLLTDTEIDDAFRYPVDLDAIPLAAFDLLTRHGFEVADATLTTYLPKEFSSNRTFPF